jgi:hypothetical protein
MDYLKFLLVCFFINLILNPAFGQTDYRSQIQQAQSAYESNNYTKAALTYRQAFSTYPNSITALDVYRSARSWAAASNADSAIMQLQYAATIYKFDKYGMLVADPVLTSLHQRKEWAPLTALVKQNKEAAYTPLQRELESIKNDDQKYRIQADYIRKTEGATSADYAKVSGQILHADSVNLGKVEKILDTHGWPPYSEIGDSYAALFLVIQHADLTTQLKYLPMIQEAAKRNDIDPESLALLKDRIAVRQGRKQLYGSQVDYDSTTNTYKVFPIEDEAHVNDRRANIGMIPLQDYLKQWNIIYVPVK